MIKVLYFARFREVLGVTSEEIEPRDAETVKQLIMRLVSERGEPWNLLAGEDTHCAVNQEHVELDHPLVAGDELALFPPVTGG